MTNRNGQDRRSLQRVVRRHSAWALIESMFVLLLIGIVALIVFLIGDYVTAATHKKQAVVVARGYKPSETHTGVGTGVGANGEAVVVVTTSTSDEEWNVIVRMDGEIVPAKAASSWRWAEVKEGQEVTVDVLIGGWSGSVLERTLR